jgi:hypothetical protein
MKHRNFAVTVAIYLTLQVLCGVATAGVLHTSHFSDESVSWSMPALFAYASQLVFSVALIRSGQSSLISNLARSLLALLMSAGIMALSCYFLYRNIHRVEFPGLDYVGAFVIYTLTLPAQLTVAVGSSVLLAVRNARARAVPLTVKHGKQSGFSP